MCFPLSWVVVLRAATRCSILRQHDSKTAFFELRQRDTLIHRHGINANDHCFLPTTLLWTTLHQSRKDEGTVDATTGGGDNILAFRQEVDTLKKDVEYIRSTTRDMQEEVGGGGIRVEVFSVFSVYDSARG